MTLIRIKFGLEMPDNIYYKIKTEKLITTPLVNSKDTLIMLLFIYLFYFSICMSGDKEPR